MDNKSLNQLSKRDNIFNLYLYIIITLYICNLKSNQVYMFYWFHMFYEWRKIQIKEPKPKPLKKDIMKKNESIDNFIKIQIPWIL